MMYPILLAGGGLLSCLIALIVVNLIKMGDDPSKELDKATYISAGLTLVLGLLSCYMLFSRVELSSSFVLGWAYLLIILEEQDLPHKL